MPRRAPIAPKAPLLRKRIQEYGFRAISVYLPENVYQALRRYAFDRGVAHSEILRDLLEQELGVQKYLKQQRRRD